jgi:tRNA U34 5-methylaminomethyl-2-thiouridine-forming methyltransferase MnmC
LPERFRPGFHIAELGFGTGLNMLASVLAWKDSGQKGRFSFTSFEAYPMGTEDIRMALLSFPKAHAIASEFLEHWQSGRTRFKVGPADVEVILGDARHTLSASEINADAWFLDGFSPAKNPELWEPRLMRHVAQHTAKDGTFATYTAAGHVRASLAKAGFSVSRVPGFENKRHMTTGVLE